MHYNEEKTNFWVSQILDTTLKELSKLNKPFKYLLTTSYFFFFFFFFFFSYNNNTIYLFLL
ncbi:hypothetical protein PFMALIP_02570 [Plasmodium falciparum MaliPS096_E11]|uniref:Uncharacterized protein n=1 Tax=Plasmodium falciparum MaliPS096_E11 TaxID=1036727 RepID=A0A024WQG7_PLAFA|nr:hypothetical protein PFMALIP_02570 [Plasmodium falciparum MaliPS096_E11]